MKKLKVITGVILMMSSAVMAQTEADIELSKGTDSNEAILFTFGSPNSGESSDINQIGNSNFAYASGEGFELDIDQLGSNNSAQVQGNNGELNISISQIANAEADVVGNNVTINSNSEALIKIEQNENVVFGDSESANKVFYNNRGSSFSNLNLSQSGKGNNTDFDVLLGDFTFDNVIQSGIDNKINVFQENIELTSNIITQEGSIENEINIEQVDVFSSGISKNTINQSGIVNSIIINQNNSFDSITEISQEGIDNTIEIIQSEGEEPNTITIEQGENVTFSVARVEQRLGGNNTATISQTSESTGRSAFYEAKIIQEGNYNEASIIQKGAGFATSNIEVFQKGGFSSENSNFAKIEQEIGGDKTARITQEYIE